MVNAIGTEGAFKRADTCFQRVGREVFVAAFTVRAELEHRELSEDLVLHIMVEIT